MKRDHDEDNDALDRIIWALILVWAGVVLLADNLRILDPFLRQITTVLPEQMAWFNLKVWMIIFTGAGILQLLNGLLRLIIPSLGGSVLGPLFLGLIFIGIGLGGIFQVQLLWPVLLILAGLAILLRGVGRR